MKDTFEIILALFSLPFALGPVSLSMHIDKNQQVELQLHFIATILTFFDHTQWTHLTKPALIIHHQILREC